MDGQNEIKRKLKQETSIEFTHVQMRRPSMTARFERQRQTVEIICFLRVTLLELTDMALLQASRRSQDLFRRAAERVEKRRSRSCGAGLSAGRPSSR